MIKIFVIGKFLSSVDGSKLIFMSPTEGEGDILFFGADPVGVGVSVGVSVGVGVTLSCLHDIS